MEGDRTRAADQRDIFRRMASCSAMNAGVKKEEGEMFIARVFVFPINCYTSLGLHSWKGLKICLPVGNSE